MKNLSLLFMVMVTCIVLVPMENHAQDVADNILTVYYFHNTHRCATCNAIEAQTRKTLETYFKDKIESGTIKLMVLNAEEN